MGPDEKARLERPRENLREAVEMIGDHGARRTLAVEAIRRVLPVYLDWPSADPVVLAAFEATAAALPERVPDKARKKLVKQLSTAHKAASKAAAYDRKTRRDRDPVARAATHVVSAVDGALDRYDTFETVTLGFVTDAIENEGFDRVAEMIEWATSRAKELGPQDAGWQSAFSDLTKRLVPPQRNAATKEGEVIRCLGNLADEAMRNGNVNWGPRHVAMVVHLREAFAAAFDELDRLTITRTLARLEGGAYDRVAHRLLARFAVRWCKSGIAASTSD